MCLRIAPGMGFKGPWFDKNPRRSPVHDWHLLKPKMPFRAERSGDPESRLLQATYILDSRLRGNDGIPGLSSSGGVLN